MTDGGPARIHALVAAGLVVDLAHASDASFDEIATILKNRSVAPVNTHVTARAVSRDSTALAANEPLAFGSDFQGGVDHLRPEFGPMGCVARESADEFGTRGLAHPGLVEPMFAELARAGSDRRPLDASAERFLEILEKARAVASRPVEVPPPQAAP